MPRQLFIAVHGVGDQKQFDTIQMAAMQVIRAASRQVGPRISLGTFGSSASQGAVPPTTDAVLWCQPPNESLGFAEVQWADLCRVVERAGYRLEEGVPWAQTLVDRAKQRKAEVARSQADPDFQLIRTVLGELGDGLELLGWLTALGPKLKLPTFDLSRLVNEYLGDVQFMTEFADVREAVLARFRTTMDHVTAGLKDDDEVFLITHSEGTVVSLMGLLIAMSGTARPPWLDRVRGWMTFGSPIDKHLVMWPELWTQFEAGPRQIPVRPIAWWNYSDCGDPIGFKLDTTRKWMREKHGDKSTPWARAFDFEDQPTPVVDGQYQEKLENIHEFTFTRYKWPGEAHLDYWNDNDLFDHFLGKVAGIGPGGAVPTRWFEKIWSYAVPYLLAFLVLVAALFFLNSGIWSAQGLQSSKQLKTFTFEVASLSFLLAGTTVLARMPRLAREKVLFAVYSLVVFSGFAALFWNLFPIETENYLHDRFRLPESIVVRTSFVVLALIVGLNAIFLRIYPWRILIKVSCIPLLAMLCLAGPAIAATKWLDIQFPVVDEWILQLPEWPLWIGLWITAICFTTTLLWTVRVYRKGNSAGLWPLIGPGFTAVVGIGSALAVIGMRGKSEGPVDVDSPALTLCDPCAPEPTLWPFFIGAVAFLFLWKLAAILFDLTFIWHRYIKLDVMPQWMRENLVKPPQVKVDSV
ncbi:MAG: hypothetical protein AABP62_15340 [Planctomycetota bacterium]